MTTETVDVSPTEATVGFIGSGNFGGTVARLAVAAGYDVVLSNSRGPETLAGLVAELGPKARAGTPAEAAEAGDLVVVSVPLHAYTSVPAAPVAGKPVLDTNNYSPSRDGRIPALDNGSLTSSALLQQHLGDAHVVKVFNNIASGALGSLARPAGAADRSALPVAGDDPSAKKTVVDFLDAIGYDAVDTGSLADSWRQQPDTPVYGVPYAKGPAGADTIRTALTAADRP